MPEHIVCQIVRHHQRGLTLIELMISLTIGLILLAGMTTLLVNQSRTQADLDKLGGMMENGRYALQLLTDDLQLAGYYGEWRAMKPAATVTALPDPCLADNASLLANLPFYVQGYDDIATTTLSTCVNGIVAGTDVLVVRRTSTAVQAIPWQKSAVDVLLAGNTSPFLQVPQCNNAMVAGVTPLVDNVPGNLTATIYNRNTKSCDTGAPLHKVFVHIYFIALDNGVPTLERAELGNNGNFQIVKLVEGIEDLQIQYGVDTLPAATPDGFPDVFSGANNAAAAPCATCTTPQWGAVVAARVSVLARTDQINGYTDYKAYNLLGKVVGPLKDGHRRHVYTQYVRLMNRS